jgi:cold shock CspA family protein
MNSEYDYGKVRYWSEERGIGFIETDAGNRDLFFHASRYLPRGGIPNVGARVKFKTEIYTTRDGEQKLNGVDVEEVSGKPAIVRLRGNDPVTW